MFKIYFIIGLIVTMAFLLTWFIFSEGEELVPVFDMLVNSSALERTIEITAFLASWLGCAFIWPIVTAIGIYRGFKE